MAKKKNRTSMSAPFVKVGCVAGSSIGLINGSMAVAKSAAKVKNVTRTRHFLCEKAVTLSSTPVLSQSQSPHPVGSQFLETTLLFSVNKLHQTAQTWVQSFDKYRVKNVEVFATLNNVSKNGSVDRTAPVELYFYEDTDADPLTQTSWIRTADRDNVGKVVLTALEPSKKLITFMPTVTFAADSQSNQNPANVVPKKDVWLDALSIAQLYSGLRLFGCCPSVDTSGTPAYQNHVSLMFRMTVEVQQPL